MPVAIDLYCGLFGWSEGLVIEGYDVIGIDLEDMCAQFGVDKPPNVHLVVQDVLTLHGSQFRDADLIVASPPCQEFSYLAMPWSRGKQIARALRGEGEFPDGYKGSRTVADMTALFDACFRIQREACEAAGRQIPMVVENVRGAQPWVGRARWSYGSFYLWGDVPALMLPVSRRAKLKGGDVGWRERGPDRQMQDHFSEALKNPGFRFDGSGRSFQTESVKNTGGSWFNVAHNTTSGKGNNPDGREHDTSGWRENGTLASCNRMVPDGRKLKDADGYERSHPNAFGWKSPATSSGATTKRKFASAMIAKIPLPLARAVARNFKPPVTGFCRLMR